jgi:aminoglycoside 6'-N-acetyltransferase I
MIEILPMDILDIENVVLLWKKLIDFHNGSNNKFAISNNWRVLKSKELLLILSANNNKIFIAKVFGVVCGYIHIMIKENSELYKKTKIGYIEELFVDDNFRNRGIGDRLVDEAVLWLKSKDLKEIWLNVDINNFEGTRFWDDQGFNSIGIRKSLKF